MAADARCVELAAQRGGRRGATALAERRLPRLSPSTLMGRRTEPAEITTTAVPGDGPSAATSRRASAPPCRRRPSPRCAKRPLRAAPEKGVRRAALLLGWLAVIFALVSFWAYGALAHNRRTAAWWVLLTALPASCTSS